MHAKITITMIDPLQLWQSWLEGVSLHVKLWLMSPD